jgi:hypothetical protein
MAEERGHRVVRLDDLTESQRRLVLALIDAGREAQSIGSRWNRARSTRPRCDRAGSEERLWIR